MQYVVRQTPAWQGREGVMVCKWVGNELAEWQLMVTLDGRSRSAATVWANGTWHTWDRFGIGGENSQESTVERAKIEAAASAIAQGFI